MNNYSQKLKDPRWQKKRLEILGRDDFECKICGDSKSTLHVHHRAYIWGNDPWDYMDDVFITLCESCHAMETEMMQESISTINQVLKLNFYSSDINDIAISLKSISDNSPYPSDVTSKAMLSLFSNREFVCNFIDEYLDGAKKRIGKK